MKKVLVISACVLLIVSTLIYIVHIYNNQKEEIEIKWNMRVFMKSEISDEEVEQVGELIDRIQFVERVEFISSEEAYNMVRDRMEERTYLMDSIDASIFPVSFMIVSVNSASRDYIQNQLDEIDNIDRVITSLSNETEEELERILNENLQETLEEAVIRFSRNNRLEQLEYEEIIKRILLENGIKYR
ncbi:MAG: permease-like cell division protein FtsX [Oscillospiraceae bacterium]|nr:permease-like cell division protein FtsX [Oscillospiraceae bacterium]